MILDQIRRQVLDLAAQDIDDDFKGMVDAAINREYFHVLRTIKADSERRKVTLTTVAGTQYYACPETVSAIRAVISPDSSVPLTELDAATFSMQIAAFDNDNSVPTSYWIENELGRAIAHAAGTVTVSSSQSTDTSNYRVAIRGLVGGVPTLEDITLNGVNAVTSTTSFDADSIDQVSTRGGDQSTLAGTVTVLDSAAATVAQITPWKSEARYLWMGFNPTPSAAVTYDLYVEQEKLPLVFDGDVPDFNSRYHDILVDGAAGRLLAHAGKTRTLADQHLGLARDQLKLLVGQGRTTRRVRQMRDHQAGTFSSLNLPRVVFHK
jgi:hypothetical protein